ncbi:hypothetical protein NDU88_004084 [Pleurodeles waltl]|uniref:Uncharacterized protein n=1 Tax=Pleurodeles waltl TaxID=8319 RepID=A0AAV7V486_PLEWA|nr:hypothetical protein NDU88_004084 [Pleurodeles waltl]
MGRSKADKPPVSVSDRRRTKRLENTVATLAEHSQRFNKILSAVLDIKSTLQPKIDALLIDKHHMREDHKKLKERVEAAEATQDTEDTGSSSKKTETRRPGYTQEANKDGPSKEQAAKERAQVVEEVEQRARSPSPIMTIQEQLDVDTLEIDGKLTNALLGGGPSVTPQTSDYLI